MAQLFMMNAMIKKLIEESKWMLFSLVVWSIDKIRNSSDDKSTEIYNYQKSSEYLWVFCSTIGEVNACRPLIDKLQNEYKKLVFLTDRDCYKDSYLNQYPDSIVVEITNQVHESKELIRKLKPNGFIICEIPCLLHDAPCRLSYGIIRAVKKLNVPVYIVNGWLYGYKPHYLIDKLEYLLFKSSYTKVFEKICVQTESTAQKLIYEGIPEESIQVTGNMKFDSVTNAVTKLNDQAAQQIINQLDSTDRVVFVAGCIADICEFEEILNVHKFLKNNGIDLVSIIAPRHPENDQLMINVDKMLINSGVKYDYRTNMNIRLNSLEVLVLNSIGELKSFFSVGDICYMGKNHNVLEPLSFNKPVYTVNGWEESYPSYPVYNITIERGLVKSFPKYEDIANEILDDINLNRLEHSKDIEEKLFALMGATTKTIDIFLADINKK